MKSIYLVFALLCATSLHAETKAVLNDKSKPSKNRHLASVLNAQDAAEQIIKSLFGQSNTKISSNAKGDNIFEVRVGYSVGGGEAIYNVDFRTLTLSRGNMRSNELLADIQIRYVDSN